MVDPNEGIRFRGLTIPDCQKQLPKAPGGFQPLPEGLFWLLCTGDVPNDAQVQAVSKEWAERARLPAHCVATLNGLPKDVHPMTQLSIGILSCANESKFQKAYRSGVKKTQYWEVSLDVTVVNAVLLNFYRSMFTKTLWTL